MNATISLPTPVDSIYYQLLEDDVANVLAVDRLRSALDQMLSDDQVRQLTIDFARVRFVATPVLGLMIHFHHQLRSRGGRLRLTNMNRQTCDVFRVTRLDQVLNLHIPGAPMATAVSGV